MLRVPSVVISVESISVLGWAALPTLSAYQVALTLVLAGALVSPTTAWKTALGLNTFVGLTGSLLSPLTSSAIVTLVIMPLLLPGDVGWLGGFDPPVTLKSTTRSRAPFTAISTRYLPVT